MVADERPAMESLEERTARTNTGCFLRGPCSIEAHRGEAPPEEGAPEYFAV